MASTIPYIGEILSLFSAIIWAFAVILFRKSGEKVHPLTLNMFKNSLALILFIPTMWLFGETVLLPVPLNVYALLALSGILGLGIGDTLFFKALNLLGAGLTGIVICMYSPFIILLSIVFLDESITVLQTIGVLSIIFAILIATIEKKKQTIKRRNVILGILSGVTACMCMAVSIVIIKPILACFPLLWITEIRLLAGTVTLALILSVFPNRSTIISTLIKSRSWVYTVAGSFIGTYAATLAWLAGMKYTQASIASALNQTSTIFIFIFAGIILREPINLRRTTGIILATIGVLLVTFC